MSSIYIQEPPTDGKIILKTSLGDLEVELWPKQAPNACRNFVQHCLDGYYEGHIFHRVIPKFIAQTGDPTATGSGGEAAFGESFEVEQHGRLRFSHRGLLAMAADDVEHKCKSQFFITLDKTLELEGQHSIFGKIVGDTIFNLLKCNDLEIGTDERPVFPPSIKSIEILNNPFPELQARAKRLTLVGGQDIEDRKQEAIRKRAHERKGVKNKALLSFGGDDDEDGEENEGISRFKSKSKADPRLKPKELTQSTTKKENSKLVETLPKKVEAETEKGFAATINEEKFKESTEESIDEKIQQIAKLQREIRTLSDHNLQKRNEDNSSSGKKVKRSMLEEERDGFLQKSRQKVLIGGKKARKGEDETLSRLESFTKKLRTVESKPNQIDDISNSGEANDDHLNSCKLHNIPKCGSCREAMERKDDENQDESWMIHQLRFEKDYLGKNLLDPGARRMDNVDDLVVIDPRSRVKN